MRIDWDLVQIYVKAGATDMRKQINGLSFIVAQEFPCPMMSGHLFLFCIKRRDRLKALYWGKTGFYLWLLCGAPHKSHYVKKDVMRRIMHK